MNIYPDCDMTRWQVQCSSYIQNADNYYTKKEVDDLIESASTSGNCCITPEEVDEKISSYTYSQDEIDQKIPHYSAGTGIDITDNVISCTVTGSSGCDCDLSDYVTFEDMADYVGDVYTKTEVNNIFVTKAIFNTYITNLQQQIDSLKEAISGCCGSSGETEYRWIVVPNDYTCSGTTKMTKEKQQSSTDGINWTDTGQYRTGSTVLEYDSVDCGYAPSSNFKVRANYKRGYTVGSGQVECNSSTTVTNDELKAQITFPTYFTSIEFGSCIDTIGEDAFVNILSISSVTIPSNITTIKSCGFNNCGIENYVLNDGLTTIEHTAFINNYRLSAITIPSTVTSVGSQAFYNCTALTTVTVLATTPPTAPTGSTAGIFNNCGNLTTIYVPAASVDAYKAADGWSLYADKIQPIPVPPKWIATYSDSHTESAECSTSTTIGINEITKTNLVSVEIKGCVTSIGNYAFNECGSLTSVTIPDSVTDISNHSFINCSGLTSIILPSGVTGIGDYAFTNCSSLTSLTINATTPPYLGGMTFYGDNNLTIYVPAESVNTYKSTYGWSDYASIIQAIP